MCVCVSVFVQKLLLQTCEANALTFKNKTQDREHGASLPGDSVASHIGDTMA